MHTQDALACERGINQLHHTSIKSTHMHAFWVGKTHCASTTRIAQKQPVFLVFSTSSESNLSLSVFHSDRSNSTQQSVSSKSSAHILALGQPSSSHSSITTPCTRAKDSWSIHICAGSVRCPLSPDNSRATTGKSPSETTSRQCPHSKE